MRTVGACELGASICGEQRRTGAVAPCTRHGPEPDRASVKADESDGVDRHAAWASAGTLTSILGPTVAAAHGASALGGHAATAATRFPKR